MLALLIKTSFNRLDLDGRWDYVTCSSSIMHLICSPPPPSILHNLCFSFFLGITAVPREIESNAYAKFWGESKVHYGRCASGVFMYVLYPKVTRCLYALVVEASEMSAIFCFHNQNNSTSSPGLLG